MSLRVLMVFAAPFPFPQGGQVLVAGQARGLAAAGARVGLATYPDGRGDWPVGVRRIPVPRTLAAPARSGPSWRKALLDVDLGRAVATSLRQDRWDVILAHHVEGLAIARVARRVARVDVPIAWVPHTLLGEELAAYRPGWLDGTVVADTLDASSSALGRAVDAQLPRLADAVFALSSRAAEQAASAGGKRVRVVAPAVDPEELTGGDAARFRRRIDLRPDTPLVLYTGNADRYQDVPDLVQAIRHLPDEARVVLLTHGPAAAMAAEAARGGGDARIVVLGDADRDTLRDALAAADVGVVPRRVCAGFPMKLLHHLAAGHPVVVPRAQAIPVEGVVVAGDGGPAALGGAIASLLASPDQARRLGASGAATLRARWTWARRGQELVEALASLL